MVSIKMIKPKELLISSPRLSKAGRVSLPHDVNSKVVKSTELHEEPVCVCVCACVCIRMNVRVCVCVCIRMRPPYLCTVISNRQTEPFYHHSLNYST